MSVAIQSDDAESLRADVEAEYAGGDADVPDEDAQATFSYSYIYDWCCF